MKLELELTVDRCSRLIPIQTHWILLGVCRRRREAMRYATTAACVCINPPTQYSPSALTRRYTCIHRSILTTSNRCARWPIVCVHKFPWQLTHTHTPHTSNVNKQIVDRHNSNIRQSMDSRRPEYTDGTFHTHHTIKVPKATAKTVNSFA